MNLVKCKRRNEIHFVDKLMEIDVQLNNLKNEREELIENMIEPLAKDIVNKLKKHSKGSMFCIKSLSWNGDMNTFMIDLGFANGMTIKEKLDYKHEIAKYAYEDVEDWVLRHIRIVGAL